MLNRSEREIPFSLETSTTNMREFHTLDPSTFEHPAWQGEK